MSTGSTQPPRYNSAAFAAFAINVLLLEFVTWVLLTTAPYFVPVIALPVIVIPGWIITRNLGHCRLGSMSQPGVHPLRRSPEA